ncbi:MAG: PAS domain-containing protein, partial [Burkholderiaceae bacterium]
MSDTSHNNVVSGLYQKLLVANNLILANIARGVALRQTLTDIVTAIEFRCPDARAAILLVNENDNHLHIGAAPSLHPDYVCTIDGITLGAGTEPLCNITDIAITAVAENPDTSQFWPCFSRLAQKHDLHISAVVPIRSAKKGLLGIVVAFSQHPNRTSDTLRPTLVDAAVLASIAIERNIDQSKLHGDGNSQSKRETRITLAIEGSGTGVWDRDVSTGQIFYSPGWKAILGYSDSDIGTRIEDSYARVHPDDITSVKAAIQAHFDQETETYAVEHRIRCKDGGYKWVSSRGKVVSRDTDGKPLRMVGTTTDVTALRELSEQLQQSVNLITSLTNEIPGLVFQYQLSPNGHAFFPYASGGIRNIYEVTPEQVASDAAVLRKIIHPDDYRDYCASITTSASNLTPWHLEYRVILPKQGLRWRQGDAQPRRLQDSSILWHGFISDITERKHIEAELQEFATLDFLTQLPNRRCFMARMEEEL